MSRFYSFDKDGKFIEADDGIAQSMQTATWIYDNKENYIVKGDREVTVVINETITQSRIVPTAPQKA